MKNLIKGILLISLFIGCSSSQQTIRSEKIITEINNISNNFLKQYNYVPFKVPRIGDGVGNIISLNDDNTDNLEIPLDKCLKKENLDIKELDASISNFSYTLKNSDSIVFNPSAILGKKFNLDFIKSKGYADSIVATFTGIKEIRVSRFVVKQELERVINNGSKDCANEIVRPGFFIIERILQADGFKIEFYGQNKKLLKLDAKAVEFLDFDKNNIKDDNGYTVLESQKKRFIGYRPWRIDRLPGSAAGVIELASPDLKSLLPKN